MVTGPIARGRHATPWLGLTAVLLTQPACSVIFDPASYEGDGGLDGGGLDALVVGDAPREDAWLEPGLDAATDAPSTDAPVSTCPSRLARLPTCADPPSTVYCEDGSSTVVEVPAAAFELAVFGAFTSFRAGVLPSPASLFDLVPGATSQQRFAMDRVGDELYFGFIRTDDAWLGHATFEHELGPIAATQVVTTVGSFNPRIALHERDAWFLADRRLWGPVTIPASPFAAVTRTIADPPMEPLDIAYAGSTPVLFARAAVIEPPGPSLPVAADAEIRGVPHLVYSEFRVGDNAAAFLPAGAAGVVALGPGAVRITHLFGDASRSTYAVVDAASLASTGNLRIRTLQCGVGGCSFVGEPLLVSVGAERQRLLDFHFEELDASTTPVRLLVLAYGESSVARARIDILLWRGAPLEVIELPVTSLDGDVLQMHVETRRDLLDGANVAFDVLVGFWAPGLSALPRAQLAALRLLGCE